MLENIEVMRMAHAMAAHAGQRQALTAQNIAQADTPGYRTQDLSPFAQTYKSAEPLTATRAGHLGAEARTVRRQGFWNQWRLKLRESGPSG
jgi:flagellar basal-body rod protein FlgB